MADPAGCGADRTGACSTCATTPVQENGYDWKFRRVKRVEHVDEAGAPLTSPVCTAFAYDLYDRLIAEHDCSEGSSSSPAVNVLAEYVYLEGYHVLAVRRSGQWYWYANDHLPTPRKLVDASGAVVWDGRMEPFGTTDEVVATVDQPLRFPGQVGDAADCPLYNHWRHYVPKTGSYLSVDPVAADFARSFAMLSGALCDCAGAYGADRWVPPMPFAYARQSPTRYLDPQGRDICDDAFWDSLGNCLLVLAPFGGPAFAACLKTTYQLLKQAADPVSRSIASTGVGICLGILGLEEVLTVVGCWIDASGVEDRCRIQHGEPRWPGGCGVGLP